MHKNCSKLFIYAIKKIPSNRTECEKLYKELNLMKKLKSRYVVEHIDSWIDENSSFKVLMKTYSSTGISSSHPIFDLKNTVLLHIQMEFCCQTLNEVIKHLFNEMIENDSQNMKTLSYYICCELLTEIIECVNYLHGRNVIHRDLKPANILIINGINGRFLKLADFGLSVNHEFIDQSHTQGSRTLNYMAPEVRDSQKYDIKANIYSLGKIVEELFNSEM
jgi:serine/threonine protein kinase